MNEPDFERELRTARPVAPPRALEDRIAANLSTRVAAAGGRLAVPSRSTSLLAALGWSAAGAALGVAAMTLFSEPGDPPPTSTTSVSALEISAGGVEPAEIDHELLHVTEAGILEGAEDGPARIVRYDSMERRRWIDQTGAVTVLEIPRQDVVLMPVSYQ